MIVRVAEADDRVALETFLRGLPVLDGGFLDADLADPDERRHVLDQQRGTHLIALLEDGIVATPSSGRRPGAAATSRSCGSWWRPTPVGAGSGARWPGPR